jgi:hypothetical protein
MFNRFDICEAYALYDMLWGPTEYGVRLHRIQFRMSPLRTLENASEEVKRIYGSLVRKHNRLYVAYERYHRRNPKSPMWPGTQNMRGGASAWLRSIGVLEAVELLA